MIDPIKQRIQELVPEVMEKMDTEKLAEKIHQIYCANYLEKNGEPYWTEGNYSLLNEKTKDYDRKIAAEYITLFDSPITLAVVVLALAIVRRDMIVSPSFQRLGYASIIPAPGYDLEFEGVLYCWWNLTKDNYDHQMQETKDFIGSILK